MKVNQTYERESSVLVGLSAMVQNFLCNRFRGLPKTPNHVSKADSSGFFVVESASTSSLAAV